MAGEEEKNSISTYTYTLQGSGNWDKMAINFINYTALVDGIKERGRP